MRLHLILPVLAAACTPAAPAGNIARDEPARVPSSAREIPQRTPAAAAPAVAPAGDAPAPTARTPDAAADVVRRYFAAVAGKRLDEAKTLWSDPAAAEDHAASLARYGRYRAEVGAPGEPEGAAGSTYVTVPVEIVPLRPAGGAHRAWIATLSHVNDVPGSSAEQRRWRIRTIAPVGGGEGTGPP